MSFILRIALPFLLLACSSPSNTEKRIQANQAKIADVPTSSKSSNSTPIEHTMYCSKSLKNTMVAIGMDNKKSKNKKFIYQNKKLHRQYQQVLTTYQIRKNKSLAPQRLEGAYLKTVLKLFHRNGAAFFPRCTKQLTLALRRCGQLNQVSNLTTCFKKEAKKRVRYELTKVFSTSKKGRALSSK